ncbi:MAG TPA: hypothetical protein VGR81_12725 [Candidatus Acidoferrales bacterium]|nr:hypothetical protein [Candidatus Acidoferrales bacterium]
MLKSKLAFYVAAAFLAFAMCTSAQAQSSDAQTQQQPQTYMRHGGPGMGPGSFAFERIVGGFGGKVVANAPFSAQFTRESVQVLSDGTRIDRKESGTIARDSLGRTRHEMTLPAIGPLAASGQVPHIAFIQDPAAGKSYILNENKKTARVLNLRRRSNMQAFDSGGPGASGRFAGHRGNGVDVQTKSLGTKTMDGLTVEGTLKTRTIPAGQFGNDKPIVITTEEWYSPDLQMMVSVKRTDPRFGTTTYQLANIDRTNPPQSMFMVPQDYTAAPARGPRSGSMRPQEQPDRQ